ncbi:MAG: hypothetical protein QG647_107 [Patescibacteria group bacterium]|nr:hypothetical protein [Patescibacteria group bacterium]
MKPLKIVHLYAQEMNIYGDNGNVLVLKKRLQWRGIDVKIEQVGVGDKIPTDTAIILGGGGQDAGQSIIASDLQQKKQTLLQMHKDGVVMLMICGMYQLFGQYFKTQKDQKIGGIGVLDAYTEAGPKRIIGNLTVSSKWGDLIGYENHSGQTFLNNDSALGTTKHGYGNNTQDGTEGANSINVFGSYLHGPLLAKSPIFADELLNRALVLNGVTNKLIDINDVIAEQARTVAKKRPR